MSEHRLVDHRNERHCRDCGRFAEYCPGTTCPEPGSGRFDCTDPEIWWRMELDLLAAPELPEDRWPKPQRRVREMPR